jgi:glycosyltransferase involved in cell wall biosynthesis
LYASLCARLLRIKDIGASRSDILREIHTNGKFFGVLSLKIPNFLALNSKNSLKKAASLGVRPACTYFLPNVIDTKSFKPFPKKFPGDEIKILSIGRLSREKRFDRLLSIIYTLRDRSLKPINGIIVGEGPLRSELQKQAQKLNLIPDIVDFQGPFDDIGKALIFVLTSDWEGTPNVVLEAMASGLPVVTTNVGGLAEIIHNEETGFLIAKDNKDLFAEVLLRLIDSVELRSEIGRKAREYVESNHSIETFGHHLPKLYEAVLT